MHGSVFIMVPPTFSPGAVIGSWCEAQAGLEFVPLLEPSRWQKYTEVLLDSAWLPF